MGKFRFCMSAFGGVAGRSGAGLGSWGKECPSPDFSKRRPTAPAGGERWAVKLRQRAEPRHGGRGRRYAGKRTEEPCRSSLGASMSRSWGPAGVATEAGSGRVLRWALLGGKRVGVSGAGPQRATKATLGEAEPFYAVLAPNRPRIRHRRRNTKRPRQISPPRPAC